MSTAQYRTLNDQTIKPHLALSSDGGLRVRARKPLVVAFDAESTGDFDGIYDGMIPDPIVDIDISGRIDEGAVPY